MTKEEQIKKIDKLIESTKGLAEDVTKTIKDLDDSVCPRILEDLGYMYSNLISRQSELEKMKDAILNQGLGNEYADKA